MRGGGGGDASGFPVSINSLFRREKCPKTNFPGGAVTRQRTPENSQVELDIAGISIINNTGIGIIAALLNSTHGHDGKLILRGPSESAIRQLKITHLLGFVETANG